jgi:hypothetical protein
MRGPYFIGFNGKEVLSFQKTANGDLLLSDGKCIPDDGKHDHRMYSVHPIDNRFMSRDSKGYWRFSAPAQKPISYKPKGESE